MDKDLDQAKGRIKQAAGDLTDDDQLRDEGRRQEKAGKVKDAVEKIGDRVEDAIDDVRDAVDAGVDAAVLVGVGFVDEQERGPYALWQHAHEFVAMGGGVLMRDRVRYALPLGPLGTAAHALLVRALLARIFDFRFECVRARFAPAGGR